MTVLSHFPLPKIRPSQEQALVEIAAAFDAGKRFVIFEGPPGVGKSGVAMALARYYKSAWVVTLTKMLQAQYKRDFEITELKGRPAFECHRLKEEGGTCETGAIVFEKDPCLACPYRLAKAVAVKAPTTICNYYSYLYNVGQTSWASAAMLKPEYAFGKWERPLLVVDEAHEAEDVLLEHTSVTVDATKLPFPGMPKTPKEVEPCFAWLELFLQEASQVDQESLSASARTQLQRLCKKAEFALSHREDEWIVETLEDGKEGFRLKPLTVRTFGERLFKYGERVLLMSATILDAAKMAESLGIEDYVFVRVPCTFPVDNRPVIVASLKMTKAHRETSWPAVVDQIGIILDAHEHEKGLILTPSNEMLLYIFEGLKQRHRKRMILARGTDRMERYQSHLDSKDPTVLLASGFWEGADLKDDYSRFQILPAIPRPHWSGQVAARGKLDPTWYRWKAFSQLIQGCGRSVRSESDAATTYVLDTALRDEAARGDTMLPDWFREALIYA